MGLKKTLAVAAVAIAGLTACQGMQSQNLLGGGFQPPVNPERDAYIAQGDRLGYAKKVRDDALAIGTNPIPYDACGEFQKAQGNNVAAPVASGALTGTVVGLGAKAMGMKDLGAAATGLATAGATALGVKELGTPSAETLAALDADCLAQKAAANALAAAQAPQRKESAPPAAAGPATSVPSQTGGSRYYKPVR